MANETENMGLLQATGFVEDLRRVQEASAQERQAIRRVYREIERRDGSANWHAALWFRFACVLAIVLTCALVANVVLAMKASRVQAFVQPVQITDEGTMVLVGVPKDLLDYQPDDAAWMDLLGQWVIKRRWKGDDNEYRRTRNDWGWVYRHSCGQASQQLKRDENLEQPFRPSSLRTSIEVKSITKTTTPASYQVLWTEVSVDKQAASLKEQSYVGTFTVGRVRPKTMEEAVDNHLGLCISGYDLAPKLGS